MLRCFKRLDRLNEIDYRYGPFISIIELKKLRHGIKQINHSQEEKSVNVSPAALLLTDLYSCL